MEKCKTIYLIDARNNKNYDITQENKQDHFDQFLSLLEKVMMYHEKISESIPALEEFTRRRKREGIIKTIITVIITFIVTILAGYVLKLFPD